MGSSDKFCLRWNDFETNISAAFQELRDDEDFFDVTLCCGPDGTDRLRAHKVILSACSPFFRGILKNNPHQNPLIYLRGVTMEDLNSLLNFMYHGEANVTQEDLNSFLAVAEDLDVKGLTSSDQEKATKRAGVNPAKFKRTSSGEAASAKKRKVDEAAFEEEPAVVKSEAVTDAFTDDYSLEDTYADEEGGDGDYDRSGGGDLEDFPAEDAPVAGTSGDGAKGGGQLWTPTVSAAPSIALGADTSDVTPAGTIRFKPVKQSQDAIPECVYKNRKNYDIQESNKRAGGCLFIHDKYAYCRNGVNNDVLYLRCRLGRQLKCRGSAQVDFNTCELKSLRPHICGGSVDYTRGYTSRKVKGSKMVYNPLNVSQS